MRTIRLVGLSLLALVVVGGLIWLLTRPVTAMGDEVAIASTTHVPEGTDPGPYASSPPAGGKHYPSTYEPGFYEESELADLPKEYEGYLVHNLEHGYVIFWYNCAADPSLDCTVLKQTIQEVMDQSGVKDELIAFPWTEQEEPLVMTSWGRIMRFNTLDTEKMAEFVRLNLNQSPEPEAK